MRAKSTHASEVKQGARFRFGANWMRFLATLNDNRIALAEQSLRDMLGDIRDKRFLDAGCGSGLFSLAAHRLGANVHSFDYDPQSVACTQELRARYASSDAEWTVEEGSVLDAIYLTKLGTFDVVYSWGVLHHTGDMRQAFRNVAVAVAPGGQFFVAIYNDQGWKSRYWHEVKRMYNRSALARVFLITIHAPVLLGGRVVVRALTGRLTLQRGMSFWYDFLDWMGGYPFEVASVRTILDFFSPLGFQEQKVRDVSPRLGCNEVVLVRR